MLKLTTYCIIVHYQNVFVLIQLMFLFITNTRNCPHNAHYIVDVRYLSQAIIFAN